MPEILIITLSLSEDVSPLAPETSLLIKKHRQAAEKSLKDKGLDIEVIQSIIKDNKSRDMAINFLKKQDPHCIILQIGIWPSPSFALDIINSLKSKTPVILWTPDDLKTLSLVPACQFHGAFDDMGIKTVASLS